MPDATRETVIIGITESSTTLRSGNEPSARGTVMWLPGADHRIGYSPFVRPIMPAAMRRTRGNPDADQVPPAAFEFLIAGAGNNELRLLLGREESIVVTADHTTCPPSEPDRR